MSNNLQNIKTDCMTAVQYNSISDNVLVLLLFRLHDRFRYFSILHGHIWATWTRLGERKQHVRNRKVDVSFW